MKRLDGEAFLLTYSRGKGDGLANMTSRRHKIHRSTKE